MENNKKTQQKLNIELSEEIAEGIYSNLAAITHSNAEFIVDFINMMPGAKKAKVKSRIILTPQHAKRLLRALVDNINKFESIHGQIKETPKEQIPFNLGGPKAEA
ncbi:MAG: DUF3467 domain-containing protein [Bacteroidota bacterium]|nr:DUF3467 domain-containing protein [Bacteroidota bacterium]